MENKNDINNKKTKSNKGKIGIIITVCVVAVALIAGGFLVNQYVIQPSKEYNNAIALFEKQDYNNALAEFTNLKDYKDSEKYAEKCKETLENEKQNKADYDSAVDLMNNKEYNKAVVIFEELGDYSDSKKKAAQCDKLMLEQENEKIYNKAVKYQEKDEFDKAIELFKSIKNYSNSEEKIKECETAKSNWGTIENATTKGYSVQDIGGGGFAGIVMHFDPVENATGYQYYAVYDYGDANAVQESRKISVEGSNTYFYFGTQAGPSDIRIRAYKDIDGGNTMYGSWHNFTMKNLTFEKKVYEDNQWTEYTKGFISIEEGINPY